MVLALDDELEEEEELDIVRFPGLLFKSPPQLPPYVAPLCLSPMKMKTMRKKDKIFQEN